jgi:hypothetical protein
LKINDKVVTGPSTKLLLFTWHGTDRFEVRTIFHYRLSSDPKIRSLMWRTKTTTGDFYSFSDYIIICLSLWSNRNEIFCGLTSWGSLRVNRIDVLWCGWERHLSSHIQTRWQIFTTPSLHIKDMVVTGPSTKWWMVRYRPLRESSYIPLPIKLRSQHAIINTDIHIIHITPSVL